MNKLDMICGCSALLDEMGDRQVVSITLCDDHVDDKEIQSLMERLLKRIKRLNASKTTL